MPKYIYTAEYLDAKPVHGFISADDMFAAMDAAAHNMTAMIGVDPIAYGTLKKLTVESDDGITAIVTPEYD